MVPQWGADPLTIQDGFSRFLLECRGLYSTSIELAKPVFIKTFREFGLPAVIRSVNGTPFASIGLARLTRLSAWWIRLGIRPETIEPGKPQQNGRHERMHRTLKREATRPPQANLSAQQRHFNDFRHTFNHIRPHEALDDATPQSVYRSALRTQDVTQSVNHQLAPFVPVPVSWTSGRPNQAAFRVSS